MNNQVTSLSYDLPDMLSVPNLEIIIHSFLDFWFLMPVSFLSLDCELLKARVCACSMVAILAEPKLYTHGFIEFSQQFFEADPFIYIPVSLGYNPQVIQFTHLKCAIQLS